MMNKITGSLDEAIADIHDGAVIHVGGFGLAGSPIDLLHVCNCGFSSPLTLNENLRTGIS